MLKKSRNFFPFYRLETKTQNGFKLNSSPSDFHGLLDHTHSVAPAQPQAGQCKGTGKMGQ